MFLYNSDSNVYPDHSENLDVERESNYGCGESYACGNPDARMFGDGDGNGQNSYIEPGDGDGDGDF